MVRRNWRALAFGAILASPAFAAAQNLFELNAPMAPAAQVTVGGTPSVDIIVLKSASPSVPLRHAGVVAGSERVEMNGQVLRRGIDYSIDNESGVVYLMREQRPGQAVTVTYRFDPATAAKVGQVASGFAGFKFDLVGNGGLQGILGFGMTERLADGSVLTSNIFGLNNSFNFGGNANLKGLFLVGERDKVQAESGYGSALKGGAVDEGKSRFLLQNFSSSLGGGTIRMGYQDISKNFAGFSSVKDAGVDGGLVDALQKERGMKRFNFGLDNVGLGALKLTDTYDKVDDGSGSIEWRKMGLTSGDPSKGAGFAFNWESRRVDPDFKRFQDIREAEREQLRKEAGLNREKMSGIWNSGPAKLSFNTNKIEDLSGNGVYQRNFELFTGESFDKSKFAFRMGDQHVAQGFNRVGSLTDAERNQFAPEVGLRRQYLGFQLGLNGLTGPLRYNASVIRDDKGDLNTSTLSASGKNWSVEHANTSVDPGFNALANVPEPEKQQQIQAIANMYQPGGAGVNVGAERNWLLRSAGIDRDMWRFSMQPGKGWGFNFSTLNIDGQSGDASVLTAGLTGKDFNLSYRHQSMSDGFTELNSLLDYERQRLGNIVGLDRTDFGFSFKFGGKNISYSQLDAESPIGDATRQTLNIQGKGLDLQINQRKVDEGFTSVNQLLDPEKDLLATLRGFDQTDLKLKWDLLPGLKLDMNWNDAQNPRSDETRRQRNSVLTYNPSKNTQFSLLQFDNHSNDPFNVLFANVLERINFAHNMGRFGAFQYMTERQVFDGTLTQLPNSEKEYLAYETKIDGRTMVKTEQTVTKFDDGKKEEINNNTLSTEINKKLGVSVSQVSIDRTGEDNDETKRNYGFWVDLGKGLRFSYGYARHLQGESNGTMNSTVAVGANDPSRPDQVGNVQPGQVGNFQVGGAYGVNQWDANNRTQSFSKVQFGTVKPMSMLGLQDVRFNFGLDTQADLGNWLRENRLIQFSGKLGTNSLMYEYKSQMHQSGARAIDRTFKFQTDQDPKRWLTASLSYKLRTLPWDDQVMIRDYSITARPAKNMELTHKLQTNPEGPQRGDVILGSVPLPVRKTEWRLDWKNSPNFTLGGSYDETILEQNHQLARKGGLTLNLFNQLGSPLELYFGIEQNDLAGDRKMVNRYHIKYDQKPGKNQVFSMFVGNEGFERMIAPGMKRNNWTVRLDYQLKF